ncbi:hypothetical protein MTR67_038528 [Solanum verrucosum]|uniref:Methylketone synthase Ib n=1 Tax=Solanum verrucosum TaxID=315347 RepID=A0AAF0UFD5_SOLVR|nr:hypothetical protein MTR67_038528 [Solanum verrucosum]
MGHLLPYSGSDKKELDGATTIRRKTPIVSGDAVDVALDVDVDVNIGVDIGDAGAKSGGEHVNDVGVVSKLVNRAIYDKGPLNPPTFILGPKYLASNVYQQSPIQDLALATTLVREIFFYSVEDVSNEIILSRKRYGSIRRAFVVTPEDKLLKKEFQQLMIERNLPDEVKEIQGADHMVMMSKPHELFKFLLRFADKGLTDVSVTSL